MRLPASHQPLPYGRGSETEPRASASGFLLLSMMLITVAALAAPKNSCVECHGAMDGKLQAPVNGMKNDIHEANGFTCVDCHGGNAAADDPSEAMNTARGFRGHIKRTAVPQLCAHCHSDATLMHRYKPQQRVDQLAQYLTSKHGQQLAKGDENVATCIDCHTTHEIRQVRDPLSPVHPLNLPATCARCHADAKHMAPYKLPTNQFEEYRSSVHWAALSQRGDLSAPSCASCHGNHGAVPPEARSVAAVCGTCHVMMEDLFNKSPHQPAFAAIGASGCVVCHSNHGIHKPTVAMLAGPKAVCSQCHDRDAGAAAAARMAKSIRGLDEALDRSDALLKRARESGMEVSDALAQQMEGREDLVKARVAVHAFNPAAVEEPANQGMAIAGKTLRAGQEALRERNVRRLGLGLSLIFIVVTMAGLWLWIRNIESRPDAPGAPAGR